MVRLLELSVYEAPSRNDTVASCCHNIVEPRIIKAVRVVLI